MLAEEQKGCSKISRGTNELLYIDRAVLREVKSRYKNLAMAWIDYKKAYDMVPHSRIKECLALFGVAENIKTLLVNSMEKWNVMLCTGNSELFSRRLFTSFAVFFSIDPIKFDFKKAKEFSGSKEKINHLLFIDGLKLYSHNEKGLDSLVQKIHIFSEDIGIEFGIEKCALLVTEKGKTVKSAGIELPDDRVIKSIQEGESYMYLGILEADRFLGEEMKLKVSKEYLEV